MSATHQFDRRTFLKATGAAGAVAASSGLVAGAPGPTPGPKEDEVLVGVSASADGVRDTVAPNVSSDAEIVHENETLRYVAVKLPSRAADAAQQNFIDAVTEKEGVKYAERNATHQAQYTPNDPRFGDQYAPQQVEADAAWDTTLGSHDVTVAVVDTGIQYDHPDLDGNFCGDEGYDFADDDTDPYPDTCDETHGTNVAGIVAAQIDNRTAIAGIGRSCLLSCRALDENGSGSTSDIADAIEWAADQGANIINLSLGGGGYSDTLKNAVSYAYDNGSFLVGAAGGSASDGVSYPAAYSEVVAVSSVDSNEQFASFSNYGSEIELCAPGVDVLTLGRTCSSSDYAKYSGTSFSTAVVSGCAGLALAQWDLTNSELRSHLKCTAKDVGLPSDEQGSGQVNAYNAVITQPGNCDVGGGGDDSVSETISDSLSSSYDYDDWEWNWECSDPSTVEILLDGPSDADFDLYVNTGTTTNASPSNYDYASYTTDSQESITIDAPDDSTPMQVDVDSYSGSGSYDLTITEYR